MLITWLVICSNNDYLVRKQEQFKFGVNSRSRDALSTDQQNGDGDIISNSYTMGCPPVRGDNQRALASGLSYVQVDKQGINILYHLHQCRPCTS